MTIDYIKDKDILVKLKGCPFCGDFNEDNQAHLTKMTNKKTGKINIRCDGCGCEAYGHDNMESAIKEWNIREGERHPEHDLTTFEKNYLDNLFMKHSEYINNEIQKKMNNELSILSKYKGDLVRGFKELNGYHGTMVDCIREIIDKQKELINIHRILLNTIMKAYPSVGVILSNEEKND